MFPIDRASLSRLQIRARVKPKTKRIEGEKTRDNTKDYQIPYLSPPMGPNETTERLYSIVKIKLKP